jgi:hypothetical protein
MRPHSSANIRFSTYYWFKLDFPEIMSILHISARIGEKAPNLAVAEWIQGRSTNIDKDMMTIT